MDQVEIERRAAQFPGARLECAQSFVEPVIGVAELRRDEDVPPALERLADALLVAIHGSRVDRAITEVDRLPDDFTRRLGRRLEHPQPELRHRRPVVEDDHRLSLISHCALLETWTPGRARLSPERDPMVQTVERSVKARTADFRRLGNVAGRPHSRLTAIGQRTNSVQDKASTGSAEPDRVRLRTVANKGEEACPSPIRAPASTAADS